MFKRMYNSGVLDKKFKVKTYMSEGRTEFERRVKVFVNMGYLIERANFDKLEADLILQKCRIRECLLRDKKINRETDSEPVEHDPFSECKYSRVLDGKLVCCNVRQECLYQDTLNHRRILRMMVRSFKNYMNIDWTVNFFSKYYEDTALGRIFSEKYQGKNDVNVEIARRGQ